MEDIKSRYPLFVVEDNHQFQASGIVTGLAMDRPTQKKTPLVYHRRERRPKKPSKGWLMYQRRKKPKNVGNPAEGKKQGIPGTEGDVNKGNDEQGKP